MPCKQTARYVIVETTYDAPEDNKTGAMLEICEIEVYGMILCTIIFYFIPKIIYMSKLQEYNKKI